MKNISGWSSNMISQTGKEVLLKLVARAIPSYCMSLHLLSYSIAEGIEKNVEFLLVGYEK